MGSTAVQKSDGPRSFEEVFLNEDVYKLVVIMWLLENGKFRTR